MKYVYSRFEGFTLIEVLVAMVIVAIAFTAILKVSTDNIAHLNYVKNKSVANWVALQVIQSIQSGQVEIASTSRKLLGKTQMLGVVWPWQASLEKTQNPRIFKIFVEVKDAAGVQSVANLTGYFVQKDQV